ncbi:MAG: extracellular solute-binding protein [Alphaproteobacteria bacterium]|nr:extracellular solute-binding protein [Alphaproteobacteria bacterium]
MTTQDRNADDPARRKLITRRAFVERALALGVSAPAAATLAGTLGFPMTVAAAEELALSFFVFAGGTQSVIPRRVAAAYQQRNANTKIEIYESSNAATYPLMKAARQANPDRPLVNFGYFNVATTAQGDADDMWDSLDPARIPNLNNVLPNLRRPQNKGAAFCVSPVGIVYNRQHVRTPPTSWLEIFTDPAYRGRVVGFDYSWQYSGVIPAVLLNGGDLTKPEAGFRFLAERASQYLTLVPGTQQAINLFASGQGWICIFSKGIQMQMTRAGANVGFAIPKEGVMVIPLYLQIVKGTRPEQRAVAERIINELLSPERVAEYCISEGYAPGTTGVTLPPEMAAEPAFQASTIANAMNVDWAELGRQDAAYRRLWDRMVKTRL